MIRAKTWNGLGLPGYWQVTYKVDGVRAMTRNGTVLSRKGKKLYNLDHLAKHIKDAEIYLGSFKKTIIAVRTQHEVTRIKPEHVYDLIGPDRRLKMGGVLNPSALAIRELMHDAVKRGFEGIVLRSGSKWVKAVPRPTLDVRVMALLPGEGKYKGMLGAFITRLGKVGTGFTDAERRKFNSPAYIGRVIEVTYKRKSDDGRLIQASFSRMRDDK